MPKKRKKAKKKRLQELGIEIQVKKKLKVVDSHYDDCGDDTSSLHVPEDSAYSVFWSPYSEAEMLQQVLYFEEVYPVSSGAIDPSAPVANPLTDKPPFTVNSAAPIVSQSTCPGCNKKRHRTDPTHNRLLPNADGLGVQVSFPHVERVASVKSDQTLITLWMKDVDGPFTSRIGSRSWKLQDPEWFLMPPVPSHMKAIQPTFLLYREASNLVLKASRPWPALQLQAALQVWSGDRRTKV